MDGAAGRQLSCDLTKVVSSEKLLLPASAFDPAHPAVTDAPALAGTSSAAAAQRGSAAVQRAAASAGRRRASSGAEHQRRVTPTKLGSGSLVDAPRSGIHSGSAPWLALLAVGDRHRRAGRRRRLAGPAAPARA